MSSSSLLLLLACLCCAVLSATSCCCEENKPEKPVRCCPNGWTRFESRCYMYQHYKRDWVSAEKHCQSLGGNLASIHKSSEQSFVRDMIYRVTGYYHRAWIGGYDTVQEGVWMWADGSRYSYKRWANNEPNNYKHEHCMETNWHGTYWNDLKCDAKMSYVCSLDL